MKKMKRLKNSLLSAASHLWVVLFALLLSACVDPDDNYTPSEYSKVYPGIVIYNSTNVQNSIALDGVDAALKLAMLIDQCDGNVARFEKEVVEVFGKKYYLQPLLFGPDTAITRDDATGDYLIRFSGTQQGPFDSFLRKGTYRVTTANLPLLGTSETQPWRVEPEGEMILTYGNGVSSQSIRLESASSTLFVTPEGTFSLQADQVVASFVGSSQFISDWSADMTLRSSLKADNFAFTKHFEATYSLWGHASGQSFFAFNGKTPTNFEFRIDPSDPVARIPSKTGSTMITSGIEYARLTSSSDYSVDSYPSPEVEVKRSSDKEVTRVTTTVIYNGTTHTL